MLQKLRSRHPVDLPDRFGRKRGILAILGGLAVLFVIIPFLLSPLAAYLRMGLVPTALGIGAAVLVLVLVLGFGAARGKPGWDR